MKIEKIKYSVKTKNGKIKSYVDKRFCYCSANSGPHIHPKGEKKP